MRTSRHAIWLSGCCIGILLGTAQGFAEIPNLSEEKLNELASHALTGHVVHTYERQSTEKNYQRTDGVVEMIVERVHKGEELNEGDRVYVRYWRLRWVGNGNPPPGHYGHANVPSENNQLTVFVKGDRKSGWDVLSPNGFFRVTKAPPKKGTTRESRQSNP